MIFEYLGCTKVTHVGYIMIKVIWKEYTFNPCSKRLSCKGIKPCQSKSQKSGEGWVLRIVSDLMSGMGPFVYNINFL